MTVRRPPTHSPIDTVAKIRNELGDEWLPRIYAEKIRKLRTRACSLEVPERENSATVHYTLLGIELKVGRHRFACPDLAAARYMRVFARVGCREFAIPYDITQVSTLADELETSWQRTGLLIESMSVFSNDLKRRRMRSAVIRSMRQELATIGPGEKMPEFRQSTKQRRS